MREKAQKVVVQVMFDVVLATNKRYDRRARDFEVFPEGRKQSKVTASITGPGCVHLGSDEWCVAGAVSIGRKDRPMIRKARFRM